jgi:hypothetical protein
LSYDVMKSNRHPQGLAQLGRVKNKDKSNRHPPQGLAQLGRVINKDKSNINFYSSFIR